MVNSISVLDLNTFILKQKVERGNAEFKICIVFLTENELGDKDLPKLILC